MHDEYHSTSGGEFPVQKQGFTSFLAGTFPLRRFPLRAGGCRGIIEPTKSAAPALYLPAGAAAKEIWL